MTIYIEEIFPGCVVHGVNHTSINQYDSITTEQELPGYLNTNRMIDELAKNKDISVQELYQKSELYKDQNLVEENSCSQDHLENSHLKAQL